MPIKGNGCFIEARVCREKKKLSTTENEASNLSSLIPFVDYQLHQQLAHKLKLLGMNAIFGLSIKTTFSESMLLSTLTGTAFCLPALPQPPPLAIHPSVSTNPQSRSSSGTPTPGTGSPPANNSFTVSPISELTEKNIQSKLHRRTKKHAQIRTGKYQDPFQVMTDSEPEEEQDKKKEKEKKLTSSQSSEGSSSDSESDSAQSITLDNNGGSSSSSAASSRRSSIADDSEHAILTQHFLESELSAKDKNTNDAKQPQNMFIVEVDDKTDEESIISLLEPVLPDGIQLCTTRRLPSPPVVCWKPVQLITAIRRLEWVPNYLPTKRYNLHQQLNHLFYSFYSALIIKLRDWVRLKGSRDEHGNTRGVGAILSGIYNHQ